MDIDKRADDYALRFILNYTKFPVDGHSHRELARYFREFANELESEVDRLRSLTTKPVCGHRYVYETSGGTVCASCGKTWQPTNV